MTQSTKTTTAATEAPHMHELRRYVAYFKLSMQSGAYDKAHRALEALADVTLPECGTRVFA